MLLAQSSVGRLSVTGPSHAVIWLPTMTQVKSGCPPMGGRENDARWFAADRCGNGSAIVVARWADSEGQCSATSTASGSRREPPWAVDCLAVIATQLGHICPPCIPKLPDLCARLDSDHPADWPHEDVQPPSPRWATSRRHPRKYTRCNVKQQVVELVMGRASNRPSSGGDHCGQARPKKPAVGPRPEAMVSRSSFWACLLSHQYRMTREND